MSCENTRIQDLLPAYINNTLTDNERTAVETHIERCADCKEEIALLRMLSEEPVPDPGDAFWSTLPDKILREVQKQPKTGKKSKFVPRITLALIPGWGWAAAAVLLAAVLGWRLFGSLLFTATTENQPLSAAEYLADESAALAEILPEDVKLLDAWADKELLALQNDLNAVYLNLNSAYVDIEETFISLTGNELEELAVRLEQKQKEG